MEKYKFKINKPERMQEALSKDGPVILICELVAMMKSIDSNSQLAKLNEISISDGKGGRILL